MNCETKEWDRTYNRFIPHKHGVESQNTYSDGAAEIDEILMSERAKRMQTPNLGARQSLI
jgi:hypothetical protein